MPAFLWRAGFFIFIRCFPYFKLSYGITLRQFMGYETATQTTHCPNFQGLFREWEGPAWPKVVFLSQIWPHDARRNGHNNDHTAI
jgi:hypothetical protein